jgi:transposase
LVREIAQHNLRIQKTLEDANIKLGSVLADILGKSGRAMLQALIAGECDPEKLADLAQGNAKRKRVQLMEALHGRVRSHHRELLRIHLNVIESLQKAMTDIDARVGKALAPIQQSARLLTTMPGVNDVTAQVMVAEIGVDMARFPSAAHLISWAGLCPKGDESAGKRRSTRVRQGAPWLKTTLVTVAWGAVRAKDSYLQAQFHRLRARRGAKKAIVAVAASMLTAAYHMLKNGVEYRDLGADHFKRGDRSKASSDWFDDSQTWAAMSS